MILDDKFALNLKKPPVLPGSGAGNPNRVETSSNERPPVKPPQIGQDVSATPEPEETLTDAVPVADGLLGVDTSVSVDVIATEESLNLLLGQISEVQDQIETLFNSKAFITKKRKKELKYLLQKYADLNFAAINQTVNIIQDNNQNLS